MNEMLFSAQSLWRQDEKTRISTLCIGMAIFTFFAGMLATLIARALGGDMLMASIVMRTVLSVFFIILMGGESWLHFSSKSIRRAWKHIWPLFAINILFAGLGPLSAILQTIVGDISVTQALYWGIYSTVLCILVGINEECIFRGLLFGGLLAKNGAQKNGPLMAAAISALVFGLCHVIFDIDYSNGYSIGMGLMKTLETAMFGFIFCSPVLLERNLWGAITAHAFFDWFLLCGSAIIDGGIKTPHYVSNNPMIAKAAMVMFLIMIILYTPRTIRTIKELRATKLPEYGPFIEE